MKLRLALAGTTVALALAACSSSSSPPASTNSDASVDSDAGGPGMIHELNDGAVTPAPPITCGSATCSAPAGAMFPLAPCCLPDNGCGATFGAAALAMFDAGAFDAGGFDAAAFDAGAFCMDTAPGTPDPSCPSQSAMGFTLAGCCARDGLCGVDLSVAGFGCDSLSALESMIPAGSVTDAAVVGPPQACGSAAEGGASVGDGGAPIRDGGTD